MKKLRTVVYIDGFNLYYRVKHTAYKWLNLQKLSEIYLNLEKHDIIKIKYFTALVKGTLEDHFNITRQHIYLRALRTLSNLEIIFGHFKKRQITGISLRYEGGQYIEETEQPPPVRRWVQVWSIGN